MEHCDIEVVGLLGEDYTVHEQSRRVYGKDGLAPSVVTNGGGTNQIKILEDCELNNNDNTMSENDNITTKVSCLLTEAKFGKDQNRRIHDISGLSPAIQTCGGGNREPKILEPQLNIVTKLTEGKWSKRIGQCQNVYGTDGISPTLDGCSGTLTSVQKDNYVVEPSIVSRPHGFFDGAENTETSPSVTTSSFQENHFVKESDDKNIDDMENNEGQKLNYRIRKLTPRECFRLMGVSDEDITTIQESGVSNSQQYKLAGNSIVVDVLEGIFRKLLIDKGPDKAEQLTLDL